MAQQSGVLSNLTTGNLIGAGVSLLPSLFKGISSIFQKNRANKINPTDPGFQINNGVVANAESLRNRVGNYLMPGYNKSMNDVKGAYSTAFNNGVQGASSSGDVLDLATKIAYGQANATNDLNVRNAQGSEQAYLQYLDANAAEGREYQNKNAYERDVYQQQLREKAGLTQAANENAYGAIDSASGVVANIFTQPNYTGGRGTNPSASPYGSVFETPEQYRARLSGQFNMGSTR